MFDYEGSRSEFLKLLAELGEEPAFIARAKAAHYLLDVLVQQCCQKREEMLHWPCSHLSNLVQRIGGDWRRIAPLLANPESVAELEALFDQISFKNSKIPSSSLTDKGSLRQYLDSAEPFNRAWRHYLEGLDYESVNAPRRAYNQYYPLEKACAFGNSMDSDGFQPLDMIDIRFLSANSLASPSLNSPDERSTAKGERKGTF